MVGAVGVAYRYRVVGSDIHMLRYALGGRQMLWICFFSLRGHNVVSCRTAIFS